MATTDGTIMGQANRADGWSANLAAAWPDALAFFGTLAMAWWGRWSTTDLVWSLWLSSLVVGYSIIVWTLLRPVLTIGRGAWRDRAMINPGSGLALGTIALVGWLFVLAFFTVHFGGFHYVHSQFLATFFPVAPADAHLGAAGMSTYRVVLHRYWKFLPAAFIAERGAFLKTSPLGPGSGIEAAMRARRSGEVQPRPKASGVMWEPYRNVVRMHGLIFFFAFAHFARLDNFVVYAVVYAAYFFPWRLVRRASPEGGATA